MTRAEADRLLARAREARWAFPSSMGNPVRRGDGWVEQAVAERTSFAEAAQLLLEHGDEEAAVELAANVWRLWLVARDLAGGRAFLAGVLDGGRARPSRARALASYGDGLLAFWEGAHEESRARNEAALEAARAAGDAEALALAHLGLSRCALQEGDHDVARSLAVQARELARPLDPALGQAPLHLHAQATRLAGEYDAAAALFTESLALNRRIGDPGMVAVELHNLGHVELHRGNVDAAGRHFSELEALAPAGDPYGRAMTDLNRAALAFGRSERDRAEALLASARSIVEETGIELAPDDRFELDWLRAQLGPGFDAS